MESSQLNDKISSFFTSLDEILSILEKGDDQHFTQLIIGIQNRLRPYENV